MTWSKGKGSWGSWHTGPDVPGPCPQDNRWHSLDAAIALNAKEREYQRAKMWAREKEWLGP
jgi:hypothetical protein